jgi:hypothetical protein
MKLFKFSSTKKSNKNIRDPNYNTKESRLLRKTLALPLTGVLNAQMGN